MLLSVNKIAGKIEFECGKCHAIKEVAISSLELGTSAGEVDAIRLPTCCNTIWSLHRQWDEHPADDKEDPHNLHRMAVNALAEHLIELEQSHPDAQAAHDAETSSPPDLATLPVLEMRHPASSRFQAVLAAEAAAAAIAQAAKSAAEKFTAAQAKVTAANAVVATAQAALDEFPSELDAQAGTALTALSAANDASAAASWAANAAGQAAAEARVVAKLAAVTDGADVAAAQADVGPLETEAARLAPLADAAQADVIAAGAALEALIFQQSKRDKAAADLSKAQTSALAAQTALDALS